MKRFGLNNRHGTLLKNTVMLAILQWSTYLLALITVPYQTRVLGPDVYGILGVAMAIMVYFQLVMDFGFLLSATEETTNHRDNTSHLSRLMTAVTLNKLLLSALSAAVLYLLCQIVPQWQGKTGLFFLFFLSTLCTSLTPDYLYRGLEKMTAITIRTVAIRTFFSVMIFVFLRKPEDIYVIPLLNIIGNGVAMAVSYWDLKKRFSIAFTRVSWGDVFLRLKNSAVFFLSRIATTAYTAMNTILLDTLTAGGAATGYYTSADKLITTGKNVLTPISDSLYPYMTHHRDFKMVKKILLLAMPPIALFCGVCYIWAEPLCSLLLGAEFAPAGQVLRAMLPAALVTLPNYILGFPTLSAMGLSRWANYSVMVGSALHIVNLVLLYTTGNMNMVSLALMVSVAETIILLIRVAVIVFNRDKMQEVPHEE